MNEQPDETATSKLLEDMRSSDGARRKAAAETVAKKKINNAQLVSELERLATSDPVVYVQYAAEQALKSLRYPREPMPISIPEPVTDLRSFLRRYSQQIMGFIGWYLIATALSSGATMGLITTPITLMALVGFARSKESKGLAGGILIAVGLNFFISLAKGLIFNAFCFMPFYNNTF